MSVLRLLILGTRRGWGRLAGIVVGVAVGVVLALLLVAGSNALETRDVRASWLTPSVGDVGEASPSDALAAPMIDTYEGRNITRLDVAIPADATVRLPGLDTPTPGTYLASPALQKLIDSTPGDDLGERYGTPAGTIPADLLAGPDSLAVVVGASALDLSMVSSAGPVESFGGEAYGGNQNYQTLAMIGALALLIPAFLLVSVATSLGAAARSERWQTLLTIGAPRRTVKRIAVAEATGTATVGAALGVAAFFALRPVLALLPVDGQRLVASDLTVPLPTIVALAVVVILGAVLAAARGARRTGTSTATHAVFEKRPSIWRLTPLLAGIAIFSLVNVFAKAIPVPLAIPVVGCFALLAVGLLVAGPYFTWLSGAALARLTGTGSGVIASRRIVRTPRAGFRSVAGLVVATFIITVFAFATSAHVGDGDFTSKPLMPADAVAAAVHPGSDLTPGAADEALRRVPGVTAVYFTYTDGEGVYLDGAAARALTGGAFTGDVAELVGGVYSLTPDPPALKEAHVATLDGMAVGDIVVRTDAEPDAIERARTALLSLHGVDRSVGAWTRAESMHFADSDLASQFTEIGRLAIVIVTGLAAAVLTVSTIAALYDRKRTFGLLQLIGMPSNTLRRVISWETLAPLLSIVVPAIALGWFTAYMLITTLSGRTIGWPDSLLLISLAATAVMAVIAIAIASRVGIRLARASENTHQE
ncbi:hypothetical protein BW730_08465 [Tessaracoccus aquimaris]|uniref:ABC3 transporter permease C-terminal domain-containing protein n=1 Tax=Tessaracoccus aquimaris TaxID=1332264 RepID=A0A1Q2CN33_9ACTN|nr:ABC transporter permease [Tessaracoccus aquimaris]AQP47518.1 hypothetical protein BW730_08465 [Tessaracoccus aquimaris]